MLNFLFKRRGAKVEVKPETQREAFERLVGELNALMDKEGEKPSITIAPATGHISLGLPEQLSDEALALPAPSADEVSAPSAEEIKEAAEDATTEVANGAASGAATTEAETKAEAEGEAIKEGQSSRVDKIVEATKAAKAAA